MNIDSLLTLKTMMLYISLVRLNLSPQSQNWHLLVILPATLLVSLTVTRFDNINVSIRSDHTLEICSSFIFYTFPQSMAHF